MTDKEKVLHGLECCIRKMEGQQVCDECPYDEDFNCLGCSVVLRQAIALLREQETVAHAAWLLGETSTAYDLYGVKTWAVKCKCSKCGFVTRPIEAHTAQFSYCPSCGARMDEGIKEGKRG